MLRNSRTAASVLQKTYDESYLTCSTAVYYESRGDEDEAMRCWKLALDQIYDHHANRVLPTFNPRSETEKALVDSLRQLELQCKERIDLLEALRLSRRDHVSPLPESGTRRPSPGPHPVAAHEKGWIGDGTIPAATYTDLSRPPLPKRPSMTTRASTEQTAGSNSYVSHVETPDETPFKDRQSPQYFLPSAEGLTPRQGSPERHTMRTTLRPSRLGDKPSKPSPRRSHHTPVDGPGASKAASLAWNALGHREAANQSPSSPLTAPQPPTPLNLPERSRFGGNETTPRQWDSHTRRLVSPRADSPGKGPSERPNLDSGAGDYNAPDDGSHTNSTPLSVSAAASAINSMGARGSNERSWLERERIARQKPNLGPPSRTNLPKRDSKRDIGVDGISSEDLAYRTPGRNVQSDSAALSRRPVGQTPSSRRGTPTSTRPTKSADAIVSKDPRGDRRVSSSSVEDLSIEVQAMLSQQRRKRAQREGPLAADSPGVALEESSADDEDTKTAASWKKRKAAILKKLPPGVDEHAAKQILNEIVVHGDEVHWSDIAGLEIAKNALREAVVYPFLRPDLFMGLREPARGMLLFGPPGTGKTMLARAVATESKSTFFSISASSLTSKYLGESEKLVRALFNLAKVLAPSIIFVDEIDSLLSQRSGSGEHEATRRIKTEFLIQWSDLQRAAAGREAGEKDKERGDANRVLVLAATNLPWVIDEAARRRFVRRQYIPLPEAETRAVQIKTLLSQQTHTLTDADIDTLVGLTDGFSGSDITALAKDAAMGPLRSLGEALLQMTMDQIRPIELADFKASLATIRPSVSKASLKEYEDWARDFGERGG